MLRYFPTFLTGVSNSETSHANTTQTAILDTHTHVLAMPCNRMYAQAFKEGALYT